MNSNFIITEEQKKLIINESIGSELGEIVKENYEFVKDILKWRVEALNPNDILQKYVTEKGYNDNLNIHMPLASFTHSAWHQLAYLILNE